MPQLDSPPHANPRWQTGLVMMPGARLLPCQKVNLSLTEPSEAQLSKGGNKVLDQCIFEIGIWVKVGEES